MARLTDMRPPAPVGGVEPRRRRGTMLLALNVALLGGAVALFLTQDSGLTRWLVLLTCSLNTVSSFISWRARRAP